MEPVAIAAVAGSPLEAESGGKPFDIDTPWFTEMLESIGQPKGAKVATSH